jgi:hypothetical protein
MNAPGFIQRTDQDLKASDSKTVIVHDYWQGIKLLC